MDVYFGFIFQTFSFSVFYFVETISRVKYVVDLARALAKMPGVYRVDLFIQQISSPEVDWSHGEPTEMLTAGAEDANVDVGESS